MDRDLKCRISKEMNCNTLVAKTKALIRCAESNRAADLGLVFAYSKSRFSHGAAQIKLLLKMLLADKKGEI